ncbi:Muscle M-line assembly protein unc-89 [Talaromyces islandicus]|uniref:Muscle M-line assembly protein unc-89 n=1 Tax=Talaromyces islandicus TaxID=28573 RepID=A0A0U1M510_TALIS|nr:Muscle M-line assembly protein unc-89 [Talaromyces islandicus]
MARAAVIPGVAATEQPAPRTTRGRGRSALAETSSNKAGQPAKRGRKPGNKTATQTKKKQTGLSKGILGEEEEGSTDDEIGLDIVAKPNKSAAVAASRVVRGGRQARSASVQSEQEQETDQGEGGDEEEEGDDDDDDELAQLGVMTKKTARPKAKTATTASNNKTKNPEPATRSARGRPKTVKDSAPAASTTATTRKPRGRPPTKPEAEKKIYIATNSSFAKSRAVGEPVVRKKVTFADLADSEDEASEKEQSAKTTTAKKQTKTSQPAAGLKAKPVRKTAGTASRGRPAKSQPAAKPLSPKKATQLTKNSSASSGDEDELAGEKTTYSLVVRSPTKNPAPQHTGLSSPVKRINFTGSTSTPSRPASRMENDENLVPGVRPPSPLRDPAFLGSPARRPPPSTSKDTIRDTPRRGPLFASQLAAPSITHTETSTPTELSPLKVSPKKGTNLAASFLTSPEKGLSTPFNAELSLLKSPAKKIQSPFVFQKVATTLSNVDEDVDMDGHAPTADDKESFEHVDDSSDDEISFEIETARSTEASDDVFVDLPVEVLEEQQNIYVAGDNEQKVEEGAECEIRNDGDDKENAEPEVSQEVVDAEESTEPQLHDNEFDESMQEEDLAMDFGQDADIPDQNPPGENEQVHNNFEHTQDDDHMDEDEDDAPAKTDENAKQQAESEAEVEVEKTEEAHPETSETHEISPAELEPAIDTLSIQPREQANVTSDDNAEDAVIQGEYKYKHETASEMAPPVSPAVSLAMSTKSIRHVHPDEIDEPRSANKSTTTIVPPAPTPPTNSTRMHSLMFSYRDTQDDASSLYDPSPLKRRSRVSTRESIIPQTPSASVSADLPFSPLAAQLSQWKASSPEKTKTDRPQRSIFSPVIPSQLKMKPQTPTKNRYSQIQTMRHSLAARHSLANSISMDDNETDTVERQSEQNEEQPSEQATAVFHPQPEPEKSKPSPAKPAESRPSMSITPVRVIRDANRTIHTVSKVPLKPEGDMSPIKFPRKRARAMSFDMELPIRASPSRVKLVPKSRMPLPPSPRKQRVTLGEIDPPHRLEDTTPDPSVTATSPMKTPRANSKAEEQILRGAVVFVDVHTTEGEDASGIFVELLTQMGAKCVKSWSWNGRSSQSPVDGAEPVVSKVGITHVVYKDGGVRTMEKVRQARNLVKCVGVGWVLDCERENKWLDESRYNVDSTIIPRGGAKRRKSMQPRALANINGSLLSSSTSSRPSRSSTEWEGTVENFRRMSPSPSTPPPAAGESFLSKISEAPKTPTTGGGDSSYTFNFDFSAMSPATPYFLSQPSRLIQQTCPPKQTNQGLFSVHSESQGPRTNSDLRAKLEAARRKSLAFKPRLESPLSQA